MADTQEKQAPSTRFPWVFAGAVTLVIWLLFALNYSGLFYPIDRKLTDLMFRLRGVEAGDSRIRVVTIDDESIKLLGQYPWPRSVYLKLVDNLFGKYKVKVAGLDVLFPDPSPHRAEDQALVKAARKWRDRLVLAVDLEPSKRDKNIVRRSFPGLREAIGDSVGLVTQLKVDTDGSVRRTLLVVGELPGEEYAWSDDPKRFPSFALRTLSKFEGRPFDDYLRGRNEVYLNIRGQDERVGGSLSKDGETVVHVETRYGIERIQAWKIVKGTGLTDAELAALKGGIVLVGSVAVGAFDHFPSPFSEGAPGVEVHANLIDNLLNGREMRPVSSWVTCLLVAAFAFGAAGASFLSPALGTTLFGVLFAGWACATWLLFRNLTLMDITPPALALVATYGVLLVRQTLAEAQAKRAIKQKFGQFVAPEVVEEMVKDPGRVSLGGRKREMTVFFLDIAHFTNLSEKMDSDQLLTFLNKYLTALSDIIHNEKGVVDKYIGDCIMAFWNAPLDQADHRARACRAAVECQRIIPELNAKYAGGLAEQPAVRIGLNSGNMNVGFTGSQQKLQYTVIGDEVNLGSRLEGANKYFGSGIMASEACYQGGRDAVEGRELGLVRVVGKEVPIRVYELLAKKGGLKDGWEKALPLYDKGLAVFREGVALTQKKDPGAAAAFARAKGVFGEVLKLIPGDKPAKVYYDMSADYSQIPPKDWDGVINLTTK